jgi:hypothetical protein
MKKKLKNPPSLRRLFFPAQHHATELAGMEELEIVI